MSGRSVSGWCLATGMVGVLTMMPSSVTADELLICSLGDHSIQRFDADSGEYLGPLVRSEDGGLGRPHGFTIGPDNMIYVASTATQSVLRYEYPSGIFVDAFVPTRAQGLRGPTDVAFGPDGNLYVCSFENHNVLRFEAGTGAFIDEFIPVASGGMLRPELMEFGPDGDLYIACLGSENILHFDGTTGDFVETFVPTGYGGVRQPHAVLFDNGFLYVSSFERASVSRFDASTGLFLDEVVAPELGGLSRAHGMAIRDGLLYVCSFGGDEVMRFDPNTGAFIDIFIPVNTNQMNGPTELMFVPDARPRLGDVVPGLVGVENTVTVTGATPGSTVNFFFSTNGNSLSAVPGCPGTALDLTNARHAATDVVDENGEARMAQIVSTRAQGNTYFIQAVEVDTCLVTNRVVVTFD